MAKLFCKKRSHSQLFFFLNATFFFLEKCGLIPFSEPQTSQNIFAIIFGLYYPRVAWLFLFKASQIPCFSHYYYINLFPNGTRNYSRPQHNNWLCGVWRVYFEEWFFSFKVFFRSDKPNKITTCLCDKVPEDMDPKYILGAFGFIFDEDKKILLTNLRKRGWDIPGN